MLLIHSLDDGYLGCFHFGTTRNIMYRFLCRHTLSFLFFFLTIFKVFIEFVTILLLFYVLVFWRRGMWDLPGPGLEPVFNALAGGFLTTAPPGKPNFYTLKFGEVSFVS